MVYFLLIPTKCFMTVVYELYKAKYYERQNMDASCNPSLSCLTRAANVDRDQSFLPSFLCSGEGLEPANDERRMLLKIVASVSGSSIGSPMKKLCLVPYHNSNAIAWTGSRRDMERPWGGSLTSQQHLLPSATTPPTPTLKSRTKAFPWHP